MLEMFGKVVRGFMFGPVTKMNLMPTISGGKECQVPNTMLVKKGNLGVGGHRMVGIHQNKTGEYYGRD